MNNWPPNTAHCAPVSCASWGERFPATDDSVRDIGRFNEAVDQALAESLKEFAAEVERWRQIFLGVLGHDLRGPLNAISLIAQVMAQRAPESLAEPAAAMTRTTGRMGVLLDALLEYNRAGLGAGMAVAKAPADLGAVSAEELELQRAALPGANIELAVRGNVQIEVDASRMREALGNLVTNAVKHGLQSEPVTVTVQGEDDLVRISVENAVAQTIPSAKIEGLFEPLRRGETRANADRSHLGLGLFISRQIARAHGGEVVGHCTPERISFTITVPRSPPAEG